MKKVYKDNVMLSIDDEQINEYKKRGFKVVGEKEVKEDSKTAKKIKDLENSRFESDYNKVMKKEVTNKKYERENSRFESDYNKVMKK